MSGTDFWTLLEHYQREATGGDGSAAAVAVFLAGGRDFVDNRRLTRNAGPSGVRWSDVLDEGWSTTEEILLRTAVSLWKSDGWEISVGRAAAFLDDDQFELWQAMIEARRTGKIPPRWRLSRDKQE